MAEGGAPVAQPVVQARAGPSSSKQDPVLRLVRQTHRSDVVKIDGCTFSLSDCQRAARYMSWPGTLEDVALPPGEPLKAVRLQLNVGGTGMRCFFRAFLGSRASLAKLDLSRNKLTSTDVAAVLGVFGTDHMLQLLVLSCNPIGDTGLGVALEWAYRSRSLESLLMEVCRISDNGAEVAKRFLLAQPPPDGARYFHLSLSRNVIGPRGLQALQGRLPDHISLTVTSQVRAKRARLDSAP
jgi:hypothetical protein